ncbi:MAG TPA: BA14K family protein, partial [Afipia sp.]|nr:BA14K family protein [Afipia sp.]
YGSTAAGVGIGLAAGAIIGGAIASSQAQAQQNAAYCAQRYRSYDPASGTYLNNDGNRYPCP